MSARYIIGRIDHLAVHAIGPLLDRVHAEDPALRRIDDRRGQQRAEDAAVGDRERAALSRRADLAFAGALRRSRQWPSRSRPIPSGRRCGRRGPPGLFRRDGDADVVVVVIDDVVAVDRALTAGTAFNASTTALTKNDMKPSLTPFFFAKSPDIVRRSAITADMSTSLNVVSIAACCCACNKRSAMRAPRRVMGTRCSSRKTPPRGCFGACCCGMPARLTTSCSMPTVVA